MSQSGGDKAYFQSLDDGSKKFIVQYNPKEFQVNKALTWEESKTQGLPVNPLQFQKGAPMTASFDLMFDTTGDDGANVQTAWVEGLLALTNATANATQGEAAELGKQRPHALLFSWGSFTMKCVIDSITVTYLMFASSGAAVRARCQVKLKEWTPPDEVENVEKFGSSTGGAAWGSGSIMLVGSGQTLTQIAEAAGADWRDVAESNGITDPMADLTGTELKIC